MSTLVRWLRGPTPSPSPTTSPAHSSTPAPDEKSPGLHDITLPDDAEPHEEDETTDEISVDLPEVSGAVSLSTVHSGMALFFTNQFSKAAAHFRQYARGSPRLAMMHCFFTFLRALSSHSDGEINEALATVWTVENIGATVAAAAGTAAEKDLELQLRAVSGILLQADCHLFGAILQIIQQSFIKCAWNMRKCYKLYENAQKQLEKITKTISSSSSTLSAASASAGISEDILNEFKDLEGWNNFGMGLFNLILSLLPPTVMRIAEWVGFGSASREVGLRLLRSCQLSTSFMSPFACLLLLTYYLSMSLFIGEWQDEFLVSSKQLLDWAQERYPGGVLFALLESRYARAQCQLRESIEINRRAIANCVEFPQMAIMHVYNASWCAFFLREYEEAAVYLKQLLQPIVIKKKRATGELELWMEEIPKSSSSSSSSSTSSQPVSDSTYEVTLIPPSHASAQAMYAYHAGVASSLTSAFSAAASFFASAPSYLQEKRTRPRPMDLYAKRKSVQCALRNEFLLSQGEYGKQKLKDLYTLDAAELCFVWSGISQMKPELLEKYLSELTEIRKRIVEEMSEPASADDSDVDARWNEEDLVKCRLYVNIFQLALKHSDAAWNDLSDLLAASQKWLEKSATLQADGTVAYVFYAMCAIAWNERKERKVAEKYLAKAQAVKGFELYNFHQIKLHSLQTSMKKAAKDESAK